MNILIVDDSTAITILGKRILEAFGHNSESTSNGYLAIEKIVTKKFDCVVIDIEMPELNGLNLCRLLSAHDSYKDIPKIILSSNSGEFDKAKGRLCGANQYVIKPFDKHSLLTAIENATNEQ